MESSNKDLWQLAFTTDPTAVKAITGKQYKGNSPKPYWIIEKATEIFGAAGIGWGFTVHNERFERLTETDVLHVCMVRVWYIWKDKRGEVEQIGQTKACYKTKDGGMMVDEDAPKKSVTDGMVKALSMLGFAGDIFSGRWDDSKYVAELVEESKKPSQKAINEANQLWKTAIDAVSKADSMDSLKKHFDAARSLMTNEKEKTELETAKDKRKGELSA